MPVPQEFMEMSKVVGGETRMTKEVHSSFTPEAVKTADRSVEA